MSKIIWATREESGVFGFPSRRGLTPRGSLAVHHPENPTGSTYSSTTGLSPLKQRERQAGFPSSDKTRPDFPVPTVQGPCSRSPKRRGILIPGSSHFHTDHRNSFLIPLGLSYIEHTHTHTHTYIHIHNRTRYIQIYKYITSQEHGVHGPQRRAQRPPPPHGHAARETWVRSLGWEDPLEKGLAPHSSTLAWRIP